MIMKQREICEANPDVVATFENYYKFSFSYDAVINGEHKSFRNLGNSDDIYRSNFLPKMKLSELAKEMIFDDED